MTRLAAYVALAVGIGVPLGYVALATMFGAGRTDSGDVWPQIAAAAALGAAFGAALFVALRALPLRVLNSALGALDDQVRQHAAMRQDAEAESRSRSRLLAAATHDLRQPLHALGLYAAILEEKLNEPELRQLTQNIHDSIGALENLFGEVTDLSKLDAGMLHATVAAFPLDAVLSTLRSSFEQPARAKGIDFQVKPSRHIVRSDPVLLERILHNLVQNALRYTERGWVLVATRRARRGFLRIEVRDSGVGIAPEALPHVFDEHYQVGNPGRDRSKGLGLGLPIVRRLTALLGHRIDVASRPGRCSVFSVEVPLEGEMSPPAAERTRGSQTSVRGKVVLLVEDDAVIRAAFEALLREWGCTVVLAESHEDAIRGLDARGLVPDAIVADYRLSKTVGTDVIDRLRTRYGRGVPAAIVTGEADPALHAHLQTRGYRPLMKPVSPAALRSLLEALVSTA